jgi:hypothetical protein
MFLGKESHIHMELLSELHSGVELLSMETNIKLD